MTHWVQSLQPHTDVKPVAGVTTPAGKLANSCIVEEMGFDPVPEQSVLAKPDALQQLAPSDGQSMALPDSNWQARRLATAASLGQPGDCAAGQHWQADAL